MIRDALGRSVVSLSREPSGQDRMRERQAEAAVPTKIHPGHLFCKLRTIPAGQTGVRCPEHWGTPYRYAGIVRAQNGARSHAEHVAQVCHQAVPVPLGPSWLVPRGQGQAGLPTGPCPMSLQSAWLRTPYGGSPRSATARQTALWLLTGPPLGTHASLARRNSYESPTPAVRATRRAGGMIATG